MSAIQKKSGRYLGTRVEYKWWRRYTEAGFVNRGTGEYWIKDGSLFFQQHGSQLPISLPLHKLSEIKVCRCRGRTGGVPIIKLVWQKDDRWLSTGFVLSGLVDKSNNLLTCLRNEGLRS
jgi:hypothetical protein